MSDSNKTIISDPKVFHRNVSTKNTGELQITFDRNFSGTSTNVYEKELSVSGHRTEAVCIYYQKYGNCKRQNCKYEHVDFDIKNNGNGILSNNIEVSNKDNKVSTREKECTFFKSQNGCKFNDNCVYKHYRGEANAGSCHEDDDNNINDVVIAEEDLDEELNQSKITKDDKTRLEKSTDNESKRKSNKVCKYFLSEKGCTRSHCNFIHETRHSSKNYDSSKGDSQQDCNNGNDENKVNRKIDTSNTKILSTADKDDMRENITEEEDNNKASSEKICKFYNKGHRGCNKGNKCPNLHTKINNSDMDNSKNEVSTETFEEPLEDNEKVPNNKKKKKCRYFNSNSGCFYDNCQFMHIKNEATFVRNSDTTLHKQQGGHENQNKAQNDSKSDDKPKDGQTTDDKSDLQQKVSTSSGVKSQQQQQKPKTAHELRLTEMNQLEKRWKDHFECVQTEPETIYKVSIQPTDPDWVRILNAKMFV